MSIGIDASGAIDPGFFSLPACIEIARARGRGPIVPAFLQASYADGLRLLHECAYQHRQDTWSDDMAQSVAAALAAAAGQHDLAEAIVTLDQEIIAKIISLEL